MRVELPRPVLIYDGACAFCRRWVKRWKDRTGRRVLYVPLQAPLLLPILGINRKQARRSIQIVDTCGVRYEGARAVYRALTRAPELRTVARIARLPPLIWVSEWIYRRIAHHRTLAGRIDRLLFGSETAPLHMAFV